MTGSWPTRRSSSRRRAGADDFVVNRGDTRPSCGRWGSPRRNVMADGSKGDPKPTWLSGEADVAEWRVVSDEAEFRVACHAWQIVTSKANEAKVRIVACCRPSLGQRS